MDLHFRSLIVRDFAWNGNTKVQTQHVVPLIRLSKELPELIIFLFWSVFWVGSLTSCEDEMTGVNGPYEVGPQ